MALAYPEVLPPFGSTASRERSQSCFDGHVKSFTVGVEEELMLLDPLTLGLAPVSARLLSAAGRDSRFREELPAAQIEILSPVCENATEIHQALVRARRDLLEAAGGAVRLAGAGTHPFAAAEGAISEGDRYVGIAEEYQWSARRGLAWGLHVHVAIPGAQRALAVHDALRTHLPELAALAGNSPFHEGRDTGLHAVRPKLAEGFPRQGIPPAWGTWQAYADFLSWGSRAGAFAADGRQLWWEVRLHPGFGTVEVRVCDQPATARESAALAAVIQALCSRLASKHDAGMLAPAAPRERIEENRWRALRRGIEGTLLDCRTGERTTTRERVTDLLRGLESHAERLGSGPAFQVAWEMLEETGSQRQRRIAATHGGDLRSVLDALAARLETELATPAKDTLPNPYPHQPGHPGLRRPNDVAAQAR